MSGQESKFDLPETIASKAAEFPESSYGANLVTLVLKDGRRISGVHVAWGRHVIKASSPDAETVLTTLNPSDIVDVLAES